MAQQIYADYHFHTDQSPDSEEPLENQMNSAISRGIHRICVTDHWDLVDEDSPTLSPNLSQWYQRLQEVSVPDDFVLSFGIEVGEGFVCSEQVNKVLATQPFDFVLGSVHSVFATGFAKGTSIYHGLASCTTPEDTKNFFRSYFDALIKQTEENYFDSLSHINYPFRYLPPDSPIKMSDYMEEITAVLENLRKRDKLFELNTTRGQTVSLWTPILKRYQDLGGTLLTIGSDSHRQSDMSFGIVEAVALLKSLNFQQYAVFHQRKLTEIPIL